MSLKSSQTGLNSSSSVYSMRCVRLPSRIWCTPSVSVCSGPQMCRKIERVRKRFVSSTASSTAATTAAANMAARTFRLCASTVTTGLYILTACPSPDSPQSSYSPSETVPVPPSAARAPSRAADSGAGTPKRAASVPLLSMCCSGCTGSPAGPQRRCRRQATRRPGPSAPRGSRPARADLPACSRSRAGCGKKGQHSRRQRQHGQHCRYDKHEDIGDKKALFYGHGGQLLSCRRARPVKPRVRPGGAAPVRRSPRSVYGEVEGV